MTQSKRCQQCDLIFWSNPKDGPACWAKRRYCSKSCASRAKWAQRAESISTWFWTYVADRTPGKCWIWGGTANGSGYGSIQLNNKAVRAHRISYTLTHGPIQDGLHVLHICDTKLCINPEHLYLGTHADNMRDAVIRGRSGKLSPEHVLRIIDDLNIGIGTNAVARAHGLHPSTVCAIKMRRTWKHITEPRG